MRPLIVAVVLFPILAAPAVANGTLEVRGSPQASASGAVALKQHEVHGLLRDNVAEITVEQTFHSSWGSQLEGVYLFPLPDGATVSEFAMTMGGKMVKGEVLEKGKAKRIYEGIVRKKKDPGLLEQVDRNLFRARVFPIEPNQDLTIRLKYQQVLKDSGGTLELRYPLAKERLQATQVESVSITMDVHSTIDLKAVYCPSHSVEVERLGARRATLKWTGRRDAQGRDFLLYVGRNAADVGFSLLSNRQPAEKGHFLAVFAPAKEVASDRALPKDVLYVVDTSGSMQGPKIEQAKAALQFGIGGLNDEDRFNVISFSSGVHTFRETLVATTADVKQAAVKWVDELTANGGTAIDEALRSALAQFDGKRLGIVVFLTDGLPTIGENRHDVIVANVKKANAGNARVFIFGVGFDQHVQFLDQISNMTRGSREYITPKQDLEVVVSRFFRRIDQPVLTDLTVDWGEGVTDVYPRKLPDLFAGDQLVVAGRYADAGPRLVKLHGKLRGEPVTYEYEGNLSDSGGVAALPRLWAKQKVDFLLEEIRLRGESTEVRSEIVKLATKYSIVTPYTSGLVVEDHADVNETDVDSEFEEDEGITDRPFVGPSTNYAIGLGGGSGGGRRGRGGRRNLRSGGGGGLTESAVELGLNWLAQHQDVADTGGFTDVPDTAHAVLAFLGAGYTDRGSAKENQYARNVRMGLRYLMVNQNERGKFGDTLHAHAMATLAMSEAYWMTRNPRYKTPSQTALDYLAKARNPYLAWGHDFRDGKQDTLTTAWCVMALKSGKFAGLDVDPDAFEGARQWFDKPESVQTDADAAAALICRVFLGEDPRTSIRIRELADRLATKTAAWDSPPNIEFLHFGTLGMFQVGGSYWKNWNKAMKESILGNQVAGIGNWDTGRGEARAISDSAMLVLCMEVYYRYDRVFGIR